MPNIKYSRQNCLIITIFLIIIVNCVFIRTSDGNELKKINVFFDAKFDVDKEYQIHISAKTNLPDSVKLSIFVERENLPGFWPFMETTVSDFKIKPVIISSYLEEPYGIYLIDIYCSFNEENQSESVKAIAGQNGEFLTGDFIFNDDISNGNKFRYIARVNVGTPQQIQLVLEKDRAKKIRIWNEMKAFVQKGINMEESRDQISPDCINDLRKYHKRIKVLIDEIKGLSGGENISQWKAISYSLLDCTNCTSEAIFSCYKIEEILETNKP